MGERRGTKALELWCRRITDGYPGVNVQNMTTSWRDGLAFCAMIHHFRPDLVDFNALNKDDVYGNNELAFRTAEQHLGIPALLDAEDMASCAVPDRLSILTYLSQFYQTFGGLSPSRTAMKRTKEETDDRLASVSGSPQPKVPVRLGVRKEPCVVCGLPVFLAEKLVISRSLYHRTCFRCARCNNQLTLGNYYETEDGQYCCETCPDEELIPAAAPIMHQDYNQSALFGGKGGENKLELKYHEPISQNYKRALSDEEKTSGRSFEGLSPSCPDEEIARTHDNSSLSEVAKTRLDFMTNHLLFGNEEADVLPSITRNNESPSPHPVDKESKTPDESEHRYNTETSLKPGREESQLLNNSTSIEYKDFEDKTRRKKGEEEEKKKRMDDVEDESVNKNLSQDKISSTSSSSRDNNQRLTAIANHDLDCKSFIRNNKSKDENTKDTSYVAVSGDKTISNTKQQRLSLVQQRMKIFENNIEIEKGGGNEDKKEKQEGGKGREKESCRENEPNSLVNISLIENIDKELNEIDETGEREASQMFVTEPAEESSEDIEATDFPKSNSQLEKKEESLSTRDSSENIEVQYEAIEPLESSNEKPITAAIILQKMIESREPQRDLSSVDTSLSNVSGVDLSIPIQYPEDLNPFGSDDSDFNEQNGLRRSSGKQKSDNYVSTNPFGSSDEDEDPNDLKKANPPRPAARKNSPFGNKTKDIKEEEPPARRRLPAPQISLNPFWSDDEDHESEDDNGSKNEEKKNTTPIPKPRKIKPTPEPSPTPRKASLDRVGLYASNTSINSTGSSITPGGTYRKKKPAPPPPQTEEIFSSSSTFDTLIVRSPDDSKSVKPVSPRTPRARKMKPAPPPPMSTSTPQSTTDVFSPEVKETEEIHSVIWDDEKNSKDETNRNRQSLSNVSSNDDGGPAHYSAPFVDKSAQGKWKRKKGQAPPRPLPHKRKIKVMSVKDVKLELDEIELQQQGLEKQGVRLEQLIRDKSETGQENEEFTSLRVDVEELVLELFALVNEKNELFRRQAELMLLRRQQRFEEEHADVEYQIRCLMSQPEATKTDSDKQREESLIQRLVEIVERRNEIVECLEMDRRREVEEDRSINEQMGIFAAKSKGDHQVSAGTDGGFHSSSVTPKKEKIKEKIFKDKKIKKSHKKDADKDVDETEMKLKRHKKKWF